MEDPLKSSHSIRILSNKSMKLLTAMLNPPRLINTSEGLPRNWKGFAELCSIESYLISNLECNPDPTKEVLRIWQAKRDDASICQLMSNLERLDRFDIIDDISSLVADDIHFHNQHPSGYKNQAPLQLEDENNLELVQYDAFVLFADDDIDFATEIIETMEQQYNLRFCEKNRDLVGGTFEHEAIIQLISQRCEKLIAILSPSFFSSPMHTFFLRFTQAISLRNRKIIPCLYKPCPNMPPEISFYHMLYYTKPTTLWNFWDKLYEAITIKPLANASNRIAPTLARREQQPRQPILETNSHRDAESRLPPPNHNVKTDSLVDLTKSDIHQMLPDSNLIPGTSANNLRTTYSEPEKKTKPKTNLIRKILQKYDKNNQNEHIRSSGEVDNNREKKRFWNRHSKRKVEVATS